MSANNNAQNPVIGIIGGKGRMGSLFADFFRSGGIEVVVADAAGGGLDNRDLAALADIVIVSVPIDQTKKVIKEVLPFVRGNAAIMDFTSIKEMPVKAMLKGKCEVMGMHPMFGNTNPIPGQTIILCETKKSGKWSKWMMDFLVRNGVKIEKMTPAEHDKTMNIAQGLIHFAEITFADAIRRCGMPVEKLFKFTGKASELKVQLAARIIAQDPGLYGNIQIANPYALKSLKEFQKSTDELLKIVRSRDLGKFKKYFEKNKKFYEKYLDEAYMDSSHLIDKFLELKAAREKSGKNERVQKPGKDDLAVLGPANTFSDIAAEAYLAGAGKKLKKYFAHDIEEVLELVESGKVRAGLIPIENKLNGSVRETLDGLFSRNVHIVGEISIPIHHCLICLAHTDKNDIRVIISHSQALGQCKKYLQKNFGKSVKEFSASTVAAVERLAAGSDKSLAVVAPKIAANNAKLKILAEDIEDQKDNSTTFVVIEKGAVKLQNADGLKTSIAFYFNADAPGSLFSILQDFSEAKINLTKIESRPTGKRFGDYIFYLDFDGHVSEAKIRGVLAAVEKKVAKLKILGSY